MLRPVYGRISWNKDKLKRLSLRQFKKRFNETYGKKGVNLEAEFYAMFPERKPAKKAE